MKAEHKPASWTLGKVQVVAFDLGDTLVEYEGVPLNWETHYAEAIERLATFLRHSVNSDQIARACSVLRKYNTRLNPREEEFSFTAILTELLTCLDFEGRADESDCARAFFSLFRQRLRCFPESKQALQQLRLNKIKIGIFTDVPYGMPRELVMEDIQAAALEDSFDVLLTSRDVGCRKPVVKTLATVASRLNCEAREMVHIGNEKKDVEVATAFGCYSILIDRKRQGWDWGQDRTISSLSEL